MMTIQHLQVMREGGSLSLVVDSSLASLNSLGSKPLRLDGILFLGKIYPHSDHDDDGDDDDDDDDDPVHHHQ